MLLVPLLIIFVFVKDELSLLELLNISGEKMKLSNASKQRLARGMKGQCRRVGDVLDWMANTRINTKPKRDVSKNTKLTQSNLPGTLQSQEVHPSLLWYLY